VLLRTVLKKPISFFLLNSLRTILYQKTAILFEAKRCVAARLPGLRPFQRKAVFMDQAFALLDSLTFLYPHQKAEILWRTASSKEQLDAETAWKREKGIQKEMESLAEKIKPFIGKAKYHNEAVNMLVQSMFEQLTGFVGKPVTPNWEHSHNHCILSFRLYYQYDKFDPDFPPPISPRELVVPVERPKPVKTRKATGAGASYHPLQADSTELLGESQEVDNRRKALQEVKEHLELLKEFEGIIPAEELANRKRELYAALPPAPPMAGSVAAAAAAPPSAKKQKCEEV